MINPQLLDFIKQQLLKGVNKETITNELVGNGWDNKAIQEGFNAVSIQAQVPQVAPVSPDNKVIDTAEKLNPMKNSFIKKIELINILSYFILLYFLLTLILLFCESFSLYSGDLILIYSYFHFFEPLIFLITILYFINKLLIYIKDVFKNNVERIAYSRKKLIWVLVLVFILLLNFYINYIIHKTNTTAKPVIYLYPTQTENIKVELDYKGKIIADYPTYDYSQKGWNVTAYPDGKIINGDGKEYSYLFWEGIPNIPINYDLSTGFIVKGEDTVNFLQDKLSKMGLTPKEYNEFIVYWYSKMKDNKYNLVHFAGDEYTKNATLKITPNPDSVLRVFMVFKPLDKAIEVKSQKIKPFARTGFTVIEWGGTEL